MKEDGALAKDDLLDGKITYQCWSCVSGTGKSQCVLHSIWWAGVVVPWVRGACCQVVASSQNSCGFLHHFCVMAVMCSNIVSGKEFSLSNILWNKITLLSCCVALKMNSGKIIWCDCLCNRSCWRNPCQSVPWIWQELSVLTALLKLVANQRLIKINEI
jgi:hypothetical protein